MQGCGSQYSSSIIPVSSPKMELALFRFSGMGSIPACLTDMSSPGAALWPCGTDEQPCVSSIPDPAQLWDQSQFMLIG